MTSKKKKTSIDKIIEQQATEIYWGGNGHVVIKQEDYGFDTQTICIHPALINDLITILEKYKGEYYGS
jgi:nitrite reductase/ring-hydroxylating ferredoxin subunit